MDVKDLRYRISERQRLTADIYRFFLMPAQAEAIDYQAGQYIHLYDSLDQSFAFSIANAPRIDKRIELHIRYNPSYKAMHDLMHHLQVGSIMPVSGPYGQCHFPQNPHYPSLFLARGVGFAPCKALIEQALVQGLSQPIYLYWGAKRLQDLYLHELPDKWQKANRLFHYVPVLYNAEEVSSIRKGLIHEAVLNDLHDLTNCYIYTFGPKEMVQRIRQILLAHGMKENNFYSDEFHQA